MPYYPDLRKYDICECGCQKRSHDEILSCKYCECDFFRTWFRAQMIFVDRHGRRKK